MKIRMAAWVMGLCLMACGGMEPSEESQAQLGEQESAIIYCELSVVASKDNSTLRYPTCCGNGVCDTGESSSSCPSDCGPSTYCGDGYCNGSETSSTCPSDCSPSTYCGDGYCNGSETSSTCPSDCGASCLRYPC